MCRSPKSEAALDVVRIPLGTADVMIAADLAVAAGPGVLERNASSAAVIGNLDLAATAAFKHDANLLIDAVLHRRTIERATDATASTYLHAVRLAEHLFGNAQAMNTLLLGVGMAARPDPGRRSRDPARDRTERRRGIAEPAGVPVGPYPG